MSGKFIEATGEEMTQRWDAWKDYLTREMRAHRVNKKSTRDGWSVPTVRYWTGVLK